MTKQQYTEITDKLISLSKVIECSKCFGKIRRRFRETIELMDDKSIAQDKHAVEIALSLFDAGSRNEAQSNIIEVRDKFINILKFREDWEKTVNVIITNPKPNHVCNEAATVYQTKDGKRHTFYEDDDVIAKVWYDENYQDVVMGSVVCSICGRAAIDNAPYLDI